MKKLMFILVILLTSPLILASKSQGKVIDYWIHYYHDSFAFTVANQTGRPACATHGQPKGRYVVDPRAERGKIVVSAIIAAKASGASVSVQGTGKCEHYSDSEDVRFVHVY